jgi:hypothetical protein
LLHPIAADTPFLNPVCRQAGTKTWLMISHTHINRFVIFAFMILVGYSLAKAIQTQSITGIILALISLSAGIYFLYLLAKAKQEQEQEETV